MALDDNRYSNRGWGQTRQAVRLQIQDIDNLQISQNGSKEKRMGEQRGVQSMRQDSKQKKQRENTNGISSKKIKKFALT